MSGKIWISSDLHMTHGNNIKGTSKWNDTSKCRPFNTVEEHDNTIINNINQVIEPEDVFYILGDFCVGSMESIQKKKIEAYRYYRNLIKCEHIYYIRGNHSPSLKEFHELEKPIFESVHEYLEIRYKKSFICLFHYRMATWNSMSHGSYHCYGHSHSTGIYGRSMDIGVDSNNFKPWLLDDVIEKLKSNEILKEGHHV